MVEREVTIYNFCPCFKNFEGELICLNNDSLCDIEHSIFAADILNQDASLELVKQFQATDEKTCYSSIYTYNGCVYCSSQGFKIRIHREDITEDMLMQAIRLYALGPTEITVDCASCIYGILLALVLSQDQASIKKYLDEFSLRVAVKFTEMELDETDESVPYLETVQAYLVTLLEDQYYWQNVHEKLTEEEEPAPLADFVSKMEHLNRLQFVFYSQVLNIRSIDSSRLLVRMLSHILRTSRDILSLNEEIHALVATDSVGGYEDDETLISKLEEYMNKSRTLDHFFGNIADIMKGTS